MAVNEARRIFGPERFEVLTVGFDARHDTPVRLAQFAAMQGVKSSNWRLASGDAGTLEALLRDLGFSYVTAAGGFDHVSQTTIVDRDGRVTEGASTNAWIVTQAGTVVTRPATDHAILRGITRMVLFDAIKAQGLAVEERAFALEEAYAAREAFVTAASQIVLPVVAIDGRPIGDGKPGPIATALRREFHRYAEAG